MKRYIVIPALNEENSIVETLLQVKGENVIVVDGDSTDKTVELAKNQGVDVIKMDTRGYGIQILAGFKRAIDLDADQIVVMDCESHTYADIVPYLRNMGVIIAGKRITEKKSYIRKVISRLGRRYMISSYPDVKIKDISNGFRAYPKSFIKFLLSLKQIDRVPSYAFNAVLAIYSTDWPVIEFEMSYTQGHTYLSINKLVNATRYLGFFEKETPSITATEEEISNFLSTYHGPTFSRYIRKLRDAKHNNTD